MHNSPSPDIEFRLMQPADLEAGLRLCRIAHWNQTGRDWEMIFKLNPAGCLVAVKDEMVIGTVTTVAYEDRFSWIGMVLVDPAERGKGIGTRLVSSAIEAAIGAIDLLNVRNALRLDATPAGCEVYRKLDFLDEYQLSRMEMVAPGAVFTQPGDSPRPMMKDDLPEIATLDRQVFGADRREILDWMLAGAPEYAWVSEYDRQITGYIFGRHGFNFEHLGPVVACDQATARRLVATCVHHCAGQKFILDASHYHPDWLLWLESTGFRKQRPFIRMFRHDNPYPGLPSNYYGILGPEFG
jgi:GNAT superfamily N-acetyltransferase